MQSYSKADIVARAEQWVARLYHSSVDGYLNWPLSLPDMGRYVVDVHALDLNTWISIEVQVKQGTLFIPGGAVISGRGSLGSIHRRFG